MIQFTRADYMSNKCSHREYYAQFVTPGIRTIVWKRFGDRLLKSTDNYLNDIPLKQWDGLEPLIRAEAGRALALANGRGGVSLSDCVCVAKEAGKQLIARELAKSTEEAE